MTKKQSEPISNSDCFSLFESVFGLPYGVGSRFVLVTTRVLLGRFIIVLKNYLLHFAAYFRIYTSANLLPLSKGLP
ncbi:hypothetical protein DSECCO2_594730 [anaerobic digester metagenome]